jgi:hypothetical protein
MTGWAAVTMAAQCITVEYRMARGFESKDVEFQQAEAERAKTFGPALTAAERASADRKGTIELSLSRTRAELGAARAPAHRQMLQQAISELEAELAAIRTR